MVSDTLIAMEDLTVNLESVEFETDFKEGIVLNKGSSICVLVFLRMGDGTVHECYLVPRGGRPIELYKTRQEG